MKAKILFLIPAILCCFLSSYSSDIQRIGVPFVQNYPKSVYRSGNQNWSVAKGARGVLYFGNSEGLLSFDGRFWKLYRLPNRQIVRAVATDSSGNVYTGGFGEIGYWNHDASGRFTYTSLVSRIPARHALNDEIWKIYVDGNRVIFQSFSRIYIYAGGRISVVETGSSLLFLHRAKDRFFVEDLNQGLFELRGSRLNKVIPRRDLKGNVLSILPYGAGSYIIGTAKSGLYLYDDRGIRPWPNQANEFLKKYQLNNGTVIQNRFLAFGTILSGVVILDMQGNIVQRIDKSSGLQNNTVLSLFTDEQQNLWTALDNGIDRIDINSPLYFYLDKTGRFGTVYSSIIHGNKIYLGTNQGLYYSDWSWDRRLFQSFDFRLIEGTQGQVWNLSLMDGQLICGHNEGTFLVEGASVTRLSDAGGGWTISKLKSHPGVLVQGTYTGLAIYKKDPSGKWQFSHKVEGFGAPSRFVEQDARGSIWVSHAYRGLYRLVLSPDLKRVVSSRSYTSRDGLPGDYQAHVFTVNNQLLFSSEKGLYTYDHVADRFSPYESLNRSLGSFRASGKIIPAGDSGSWFIQNGRIALADFSRAGKIRVDSSTLNVLNGRMVQYYENISRISPDIYLISVDDGFVMYNAALKNRLPALPRVLIRRVENTTTAPVLLTEEPRQEISVPHDQNNVRIAFSLPFYSPGETKYQYLLEGYSREWSEWSTQPEKEFSNLPPGDYTFMVRAKV
ncbi:MAG TPA: triple tyrosine motif-containing protein, partial [Sphingobacteriaceae bacterium]